MLPLLRAATAILFVGTLALGMSTMRNLNDMRIWVGAASNAVMSLSLAERALQVDLLKARAGLLRSDKPIDGDLASAHAYLAELRQLPMGLSAKESLAKVEARTVREAALVERFKDDNRILQQALVRFTAYDPTGAKAQSLLSSRILKLTLDTSVATTRNARVALAHMPSAQVGTPNAQFIADARLLVTTLPEIDQLLRSIRAVRVDGHVLQLQSLLKEEGQLRSSRIRTLEASLVTMMILLVASLIALLLSQRQRTRELQAQAANERLSAAIAMPLIDTGHASFGARVEDAVRRLAIHIGAQKLQLNVPSGTGFAHFSWPGDDLPADWLRKLIAAADADNGWQGDKVMATRGGDLGHRAIDLVMLELGLNDLVLLRTTGPCPVYIGFEPDGRAVALRRDHIAGVASAIVAIAHGARREAMQIERERLERTLARARRMEVIGAMASGIAHNLNNIIGAIAGFAEMGQERTRTGSPARYKFDEIQGAVDRARDLVDEVLNFAKQGRSAKRPLNLYEILEDSVHLLNAASRGDPSFMLRRPTEGFRVLGADRDLRQVFLNICNNASHVSSGRAVEMLAESILLKEKRHLSHGSLLPAKYVVVSISDCGPGVPEGARRRLFEPFFTTKSGGTGLGLSTAWEIVQDHAGTIDVQNRAGGGARFSIWLPELILDADTPLVGEGSRILFLAEADALAQEEELLAELGYEPLGFEHGTDVDALREIMRECDALLIASRQPRIIFDLLSKIGDCVGSKPLLLASPEGQGFVSAIPSSKLRYPLQSHELAGLLAGRVRHFRPNGMRNSGAGLNGMRVH